MNRLWTFILGLNPFSSYLDRKVRLAEIKERTTATIRAEKAEERAAFLAAINSMTQVAVEASRASQAQARTLSVFLDSFKVAEAPKLREWDPEADDERYLNKHYPEELVGLTKLEQFEKLLDKLDE